MTFQDTSIPFSLFGFLMFLSVIIFTVILVLPRAKSNKKEFVTGIIAILFLPLAVSFAIAGFAQDKSTSQRVESALVNNITQKYDAVEKVIFKKEDNDTYYFDVFKSDPQDIIVVIDGKEQLFTFTQNEETFEPTLKTAAGTSPEGIDADDLLTNKKD